MILILFFVFLLSAEAFNDDAPVINTKNGLIKGISDQNANMYLGIPFALPPVDDLRWREPIRAKAWYPNILNATNFKPACPQVNCTSKIPTQNCPTEVRILKVINFL
jgi:carboxylesterase type B